MKKFKIFLLLSILLCFGFMLSSEVHAQGDGPKLFEEGDVLPATTRLRISWTETQPYTFAIHLYNNPVKTDSDNFNLTDGYGDAASSSINGEVITSFYASRNPPYYWLSPYDTQQYIEIDTSDWSLSKRTVSTSTNTILYWEVLSPPLPEPKKIFEEGDELPAGYIKISWDFTGKPIAESATFVISSDHDLIIEIYEWEEANIEMTINFDEQFYLDTPGYTIITLTSPETITDFDVSDDDYEYNDYIHGALFWEVVPPEYLGGYDNVYDGEQLEIEEGYILPESIIGINLLFNNTGGNKSGTVVFTFSDTEYEYGQIILTAQEDNLSRQVASAEITVQPNPSPRGWDIYTIDDSLANQTFGSTRGILFAGVLLDFSWATEEERTITDITVEGDLELDIIFTRILTEEEIAYQEGYSNGYITAREIFGWKDGEYWYNGIDAWNLGEKYARELYGYYDSTTDEWLTVDEYVARYGPGNGGGNGSTGASDFYANFDKYFIPAMIIVFGGAIVLTILKVFKGREQ